MLAVPSLRPRQAQAEVVAPLAAWTALVVAALVWGTLAVADAGVSLRAAPLMGRWRWQAGPLLVPAGLVGLAVVVAGPALAARLAGRRAVLAGATGVVAAAWTLALAAAGGWDRVTAPLTTRHEYEPFAARVSDIGDLVRGYAGHLSGTPVHVQGHPPGPVVLAWALDRIGLGGAGWLAALAVAGWGVAAAAAVGAVGIVAGRDAARRAAPVLAVLPAAVWAGTSMDGLFAGMLAVAVALGAAAAVRSGTGLAAGSGAVLGAGVGVRSGTGLVAGSGAVLGAGVGVRSGTGLVAGSGAVLGAGVGVRSGAGLVAGSGAVLGAGVGVRSGAGLAAGSGAVLGAGVGVRSGAGLAAGSGAVLGLALLMTYGAAPFVVVVAVLILVIAPTGRLGRLLVAAGAGVVAPLALAAAAGFWWPAGLAATGGRYWAGVAGVRPALYTTVLGNPAALALAVGPAVAVGLVAIGWAPRARPGRAALLPVVVLAAVVVADLSQMSRGEVERIWLPFVPWLALAAPGDRRSLLALQVATALLLQSTLASPW